MQILSPKDGVAWELAKLHTVSNAHYTMTVGVHTLLHFSLSSPISILADKIFLHELGYIKDSVIARIIKAHSYLQTSVDAHALHSTESVLWAHNFPYSAWNFKADEGEGIGNFIRLITDGWDGHPIYKSGQDFTIVKNHYNIGIYKQLLWELKKVVDLFVEQVFLVIKEENLEIEFAKMFLTKLNPILPKNSFLKNVLAQEYDSIFVIKKLLSYYIHNAMHHSIDHAFYESELLDKVHLVIRKPVPFSDKSAEQLDIMRAISDINLVSDRSKFNLANNMFFHSHISRSLYDFIKHGGYFPKNNSGFLPKMEENERTDKLVSIQEEFMHNLMEIYNQDGCPIDISLIGISIQS